MYYIGWNSHQTTKESTMSILNSQARKKRALELGLSPLASWADISRAEAKKRRSEKRAAIWQKFMAIFV
jgi:hypothetical protein